MLKRARLLNFQAHRKTELEFSNAVNVITGTSDSGKSAIIRGIEWVLDNRPPGDSIKNWNAQDRDKISVELCFSGSETIQKERFKGKAKYIIGETTFEAVKQDVPSEVSDSANLSECNVQTQHQPYFFLNDTPGEVARKLNELVGLDIIDHMYQKIDSRIRNVSSDIKSTGASIKTLTEEIEALAYVDDLHNRIVALEAQVEEHDTLEKEIIALKAIIDQIESAKEEVKTFSELIGAEKQVKENLAEIEKFFTAEKECKELVSLIESIEKTADDLHNEKDWLKCEPLYDELSKLIQEDEVLQTSIQTLERSINKVSMDTNAYEYEKNQVDKLLVEYIKKLRTAKACPTCFSQITEKTIKAIEASL